jgi:Domain of unknown function (DUF2470)
VSHQQSDRDWSPKAFLKHLNERHPDTVRFLASYATGNREMLAAELMAVENDQLTFSFETPHGSARGQLTLTAPVRSRSDLLAQLTDVLAAARAAAPSEPLTSLESHISDERSASHRH